MRLKMLDRISLDYARLGMPTLKIISFSQPITASPPFAASSPAGMAAVFRPEIVSLAAR